MALTTLGTIAIEKAVRGEIPEFHQDADRLRADLLEFRETGMLFYPYDFDTPWMPEDYDQQNLYGMTFVSEAYLRRSGYSTSTGG